MGLTVFIILSIGILIGKSEASSTQGVTFSQVQMPLNITTFVEVHSNVKSALQCTYFCLSNAPCFGLSYEEDSEQCQLLFQNRTAKSSMLEITAREIWLSPSYAPQWLECPQPPETQGNMINTYIYSGENVYINSTCLHNVLSSVTHELRSCQSNRSWDNIKDLTCGEKIIEYMVTVLTGDRDEAKTDARVYIEMFGKLGDSGERQLDDKNNNFEIGMEDKFILESPYLGILEELRIRHDNTGSGPGWFLDKIIVEDMDNHQVYNFPAYRWLSDVNGGKLFTDLFPSAIEYKVTVYTGDKNLPISDMYRVTLFGEK